MLWHLLDSYAVQVRFPISRANIIGVITQGGLWCFFSGPKRAAGVQLNKMPSLSHFNFIFVTVGQIVHVCVCYFKVVGEIFVSIDCFLLSVSGVSGGSGCAVYKGRVGSGGSSQKALCRNVMLESYENMASLGKDTLSLQGAGRKGLNSSVLLLLHYTNVWC